MSWAASIRRYGDEVLRREIRQISTVPNPRHPEKAKDLGFAVTLTSTEAALPNLLMEGKTLDECCVVLDIRRSTARTDAIPPMRAAGGFPKTFRRLCEIAILTPNAAFRLNADSVQAEIKWGGPRARRGGNGSRNTMYRKLSTPALISSTGVSTWIQTTTCPLLGVKSKRGCPSDRGIERPGGPTAGFSAPSNTLNLMQVGRFHKGLTSNRPPHGNVALGDD